MAETNDKLIDLINYVGELIKIGEKPVFSLKKYRQLVYREAELKNRIGITHDVSTDEEQIWLKIERLQRRNPPSVPHILTEWLSVQRDPFVFPKSKDVITATISKKDAEAHLENGTLLREDIAAAMKPTGDGEWCDVIFRLENQYEIKEGIEEYISRQWIGWSESEKPRRETIRIYESFFSLQQSIQIGGAEGGIEKGEKTLSISTNTSSPQKNNSKANGISKSDSINVDPKNPPDLSHTKILMGRVNNEIVKNWNHLSKKIHEVAYDRLGSFESLVKVTQANIVKGERGDKGFRYISRINLSIQGENANKIWINTMHLARQIGIPIKLNIEWRNKSKAAHPGKRAKLKWEPIDTI